MSPTSYTGTGSPAVAPAAVPVSALLADIRAALGDATAATYSDADLITFLADAVREYSQHLPRYAVARLATVAGQRRYALPDDALAILSVGRDDDMTAPLTRLSYKRRDFDATAGAYDFLPRHDLTNPPALLLSFDPGDGALLHVHYARPHAAPRTATGYLTVPAAHHHVLLQYVLFAAARRLQAIEQANPTGGSLLMAQLAANTRRLELAYLNALNRILTQRAGHSAVVVWGDGQ